MFKKSHKMILYKRKLDLSIQIPPKPQNPKQLTLKKVFSQTMKLCFKSLAQSVFFFCLSQVYLGPYWVLLIYFWGYDQISKKYLYMVIQTFNFCFGSIALSNCFQCSPLWGLCFTFLAVLSFLGDWGQVQKNFRTYKCRQATLVLEIQLFLFVWFGPEWGVFALVEPFIEVFLGQHKIQ